MTDEFKQANRAFDLFTLAERHMALERFAQLRYPSIEDRFFEAVHSVIKAHYEAQVVAKRTRAITRDVISGDSRERFYD